MTSSSADCLTPSDSWTGGGGMGGSGWRALGNETPHRDSAYFSDSDWEGDGINRRSSDVLIASRPSGGRGSDRGILTGIEEKTEEEGETGEKSPLRNSTHMSETNPKTGRTVEMGENNISHFVNDMQNKRLNSAQRDDSGIFNNESITLCDDPPTKDCVNLIDKLFSKLDNEQLKVLSHSGGYGIDSHYTDGIISHVAECKHQDSAKSDINVPARSPAEPNHLTKSVSGSQVKHCIMGLNSKDYTSVTNIDNNLAGLNLLKSGDETVEYATPSLTDSTEIGLCKSSSIQASHTTVGDVSTPNNDNDDKVSGLTCPWVEQAVAEWPGLDHNELGLRNLHCSDGSEDREVTAEMEKQQAAAELSTTVKEASPLREAASQMDSANNVDNNSCEGLDVTHKELWSALGEDEEDEEKVKTESGVVKGEFDCYRFSQLRDLWPDENDQWASPEKRSQEVKLRSEFFPGFGNKAWEVSERLVVGQEYWENENDEFAGSEPHPTVLEGCEETWNNETQGLDRNVPGGEIWGSNHTHNQQTISDIQQEENIENLGEVDSVKRYPKIKISDMEVENVEIPEKETLERGGRQISLCTEAAEDREGRLDSTEAEENQNFNRWPQNQLCNIQREETTSVVQGDEEADSNLKKYTRQTLEDNSSKISICITEPHHVNLENVELGFDSEPKMRPWCARQYIEERMGIVKVEQDYRSPNNVSDLDVQEDGDQSYSQVDNFSSVDFPSPPPSIDLDVQDDKLESLDDSFPSPPPSIVEEDEDFISHINLEAEPYISDSAHNTDVSEPPPASTENKGISANLSLSSVRVTLIDESSLTSSVESQEDHKNLSDKTPPTMAPVPLNNLPELLISEWKDLDEEPLEDFEKLEQLCCISGDEEESLGELFLGNLELLESLKKTPDQKDSSTYDGEAGKEGQVCNSTSPEDSRTDLKENKVPENSDKFVDSVEPMILDLQENLPPEEEKNDKQRSQASDMKEQGSRSKMTTKNGLMMQVCEERLQFSLSENVKTNMLWGATVIDMVTLRPWGEQVTESSAEMVDMKEKTEDESQEEQEPAPNIQPLTESEETEPFTVIEQSEVMAPQPTANQAMKAKLARLSLALPPLALNLPLTTGKGGFGDGSIGNRIGRRRGLSSGSDPDEEEEDEPEDENSRRVIVVTETDIDKRVGLRSLLKSPKEPMDRERDRGRNVSFFDDVTIYLFDQETPTNELSSSAPTSPASVSVKSTKLDMHGGKSKESKRREDLSIKPRSPVGANPVTSSRFTVCPADDPHLV
ncbi:uncharacterized protein lmtk3 [Pholidichthys leucotaenia]